MARQDAGVNGSMGRVGGRMVSCADWLGREAKCQDVVNQSCKTVGRKRDHGILLVMSSLEFTAKLKTCYSKGNRGGIGVKGKN